MSEPNNNEPSRVVVPLAMETTSREILARIGASQETAGMDTVMNALKTLYDKGVTVPVIKNVQWGTLTATATETKITHSPVDVTKSFILLNGSYARGDVSSTYFDTVPFIYNRTAAFFVARYVTTAFTAKFYLNLSWQIIEFY